MAAEMTERIKAKMGMARAWLQDAIGKSNDEVLEILRERRETIVGAIKRQSEAQSRFSPAEGEWCTQEVGRHMTYSHRNISALMRMLAAGKTMEGEPKIGIAPEGAEDVDTICVELGDAFDKLQEAFEVVCSDGANLEITFGHPWFGDLNARGWFVFCSLHTTAHISQIERIVASEGFPEN